MAYTPEEQKIIDGFVATLAIGIPAPESKGAGGYTAQNPEGTAAGKYQFTEQWLKGPNGKHGITAFAKENGYGNVTTLEQFKADPNLQDVYFRYYAKEILYPDAKTQYQGKNPLDLSLTDIGALNHFDGKGEAQKQISSGKLKEATVKGENGAKYTNKSRAKYLDEMNKAIKNSGISTLTKSDLISAGVDNKTNPDKIISWYESEEKRIAENKHFNDKDREIQRQKLNQGVVDNGHEDIINPFIKKRNSEQKEAYSTKINDYNALKDFIENDLHLDYKEDVENGDKAKWKEEGSVQGFTKDLMERREAFRKKYPHLFKSNKRSKTPSDAVVNIEKLFGEFETQHKELTGETIKVEPGNMTSNPDRVDIKGNTVGGGVQIKVKRGEGEGVGILTPVIGSGMKFGKSKERYGTLQLGLNDLSSDGYKPVMPIDPKNYPKSVTPQQDEEEKAKEEAKKRTAEEEAKKDPANRNKGLAEEYYKTSLALGSVEDQQFNYKPGKQELNVDAIVGLSLGLIGNEDAKRAHIPLRTEEVSEAMMNYTAELMNKSNEGLPVEVEAAMKAKLADAYQGGLQNIVNASAGNRATVLGNLGGLEQAKTKGLVGIQVADYEAKDRAFAQYGKAIEYINDFDTRRDIANHGIKYKEAYRKKLQGEKLAETGFAKMIEALKYQKNNGPGSANDMYRSLLMQKMFGFDPKMKDDGTGTVKGTKSEYDLRKANNQAKYDSEAEVYKRFQTLNPDQKLAYDNLMAETQDQGTQSKFIDYLKANPNADTSKISMDNLDLALKRDDFGLLSQDRDLLTKGVKSELEPTGLQNITEPLNPIENFNPEIPTIQTGLLNGDKAYQEHQDKLKQEQLIEMNKWNPPPAIPGVEGIPNPFDLINN
jgi:hypothetical protein